MVCVKAAFVERISRGSARNTQNPKKLYLVCEFRVFCVECCGGCAEMIVPVQAPNPIRL
jgi:hypothetical protein